MKDSLYVVQIRGKHSLLKPPLSEKLRAGSVLLNPGEEVGEHKTEGREEAIIILRGDATIICEGESFLVSEKQFAYIPPESLHNVLNETKEIVEYVYVVAPISDHSAIRHSHGGTIHTH